MTETEDKIRTVVMPDSKQVSAAVARTIADLIREKQSQNKPAVLGLATGSTPTGVYAELVRLHKEQGLSFKNVITFNLDEYYPMQPNELQSYRRFMAEHLFDHIDIKRENTNVPDGTLPIEKVAAYCEEYERKIRDLGGLDIQILGIGRTGHIGFNEPGSTKQSKTRLISLDRTTRLDAAADFFGEQYVPRRAITMGVGTILAAKKIIIMAFGEGKARVAQAAILGPITSQVAASFLQEHPDATFYLDEAAAAKLPRYAAPWLVGPVNWKADPKMIRKAVIWLALAVKKPILKLTDEDYNEHGLQDLVAEHGPAYAINVEVFRSLTETISGWPGGKPQHAKRPGDISRPNDSIWPKRSLIFSPHPDDDVISMGGTLIRLVDQGHDVHVAYQTSGNIAVFDSDAIRFADFASDYNAMFNIGGEKAEQIERHIEEFLRRKQPGQADSPEIQKIKGVIRRGECRAAAREVKLSVDNLHFLDLPFYETGAVRKKPLGPEDIRITVELLRKLKPHQIYAAGDLSDPHGTHRVCLSAIFQAVEVVRDDEWFKNCEIFLYRGAWQEWEPEVIDMAVPISPQELMRKRHAIFKHQSQKDRAMFPGSDSREFWQRAEDRNRNTAKLFDQLGFAEYEAIEGFVKWTPPAPKATTK